MTALVLVCLVVALVCAAAAVSLCVWQLRRPRAAPSSLLSERLRSRVVVTLKSGSAFQGLLYASDDVALVLREASAIDGSGARTVVDGEIVVLRSEVDYLQRP